MAQLSSKHLALLKEAPLLTHPSDKQMIDAVTSLAWHLGHTPMTEFSGRPRRVLLVEDHPAVAEGLTRLLRVLGYDVRAERNPVDAIATAETFQPDVALLDIGLPAMNGYALAMELRARLGGMAPVLIALSGYDQPLDLRHSQATGFATHLVKPIDAEDLVNAIDRFAPVRQAAGEPR